MNLTWYGMSCFRLRGRGLATIVTDPFSGRIGLGPPKLKGDVVTISHDAGGHNNANSVTGRRHTIDGPGEYEIGGVFITAISTRDDLDSAPNILFLFDFDGLSIAHLGDMSKVPSPTQIEALEQVDILLVPVGGGQSLNSAQAAELVSMLEPSVVVPMHYKLPGIKLELEGVERFLNEMGITAPEEEPYLKITAGSLPDETQVVLLTPKS